MSFFLDFLFLIASAPKNAATKPATATKYVGAISAMFFDAFSAPKIENQP